MSDYRVTVKVQNNNIFKKIESFGYKSILEFTNNNDVSYPAINSLVNMKSIPLDRFGNISKSALKLAKY